MNLTPKQLRILQLIRDWRVRRGYSPTMQELADEIGVSKVTVFEHVEALIKKGALVREPNKARSLSIAEGVAVPDESRPLRFPLIGKIAAGNPIEKVADMEEIDLVEFLGSSAGRGEVTEVFYRTPGGRGRRGSDTLVPCSSGWCSGRSGSTCRGSPPTRGGWSPGNSWRRGSRPWTGW